MGRGVRTLALSSSAGDRLDAREGGTVDTLAGRSASTTALEFGLGVDAFVGPRLVQRCGTVDGAEGRRRHGVSTPPDDLAARYKATHQASNLPGQYMAFNSDCWNSNCASALCLRLA